MMFIGICIATILLGVIGQSAVKSKYKKWSSVPSNCGLTGAEIAQRFLQSNGLPEAQIKIIPGTLTDFFDPTNNVLNLSSDVANGNTVAALAIALHESGHMVDFARKYKPMALRRTMVPLVNASQWICWIAIFIGIVLQSMGLVYIAIAMYGLSLIFALVTLPVEFHASRQAVEFLDTGAAGLAITQNEVLGARQMLTAAALTYVLAAAASALNLLYMLFMTR